MADDPLDADPEHMAHNTTERLPADMEAWRRHLGIKRWLLYGGHHRSHHTIVPMTG